MLKIENISVPVGGLVTTLADNRVSMVCEVSGIPAPQVTWERDGVEVQRGGKFYTIDSTSHGNNGNYSCIARNSAGEVKATSQLKILGNYALSCFAVKIQTLIVSLRESAGGVCIIPSLYVFLVRNDLGLVTSSGI